MLLGDRAAVPSALAGSLQVKSIRYRGWQFKVALAVFVGQLRGRWASSACSPAIRCRSMSMRRSFFTIVYFAFFLLMPCTPRVRRDQAGSGTRVYHGHE